MVNGRYNLLGLAVIPQNGLSHQDENGMESCMQIGKLTSRYK